MDEASNFVEQAVPPRNHQRVVFAVYVEQATAPVLVVVPVS